MTGDGIMVYDVSISECKTWIQTTVRCPITMASTLEFLTCAAQTGVDHHINQYLFDVRESHNIKSPFHDYQIAHHHLRGLGYNQASKIAFLVTEGDASHDFFQITAANAGYYQCRVFDGEDKATSWLKGDGDAQAPPHPGDGTSHGSEAAVSMM